MNLVEKSFLMGGKFANVPAEKGTKIQFELESKLGKYDVLYRRW